MIPFESTLEHYYYQKKFSKIKMWDFGINHCSSIINMISLIPILVKKKKKLLKA